MHREIEAKILNVDPDKVKETLKAIGATFHGAWDLHQIAWLMQGEGFRASVRVRRSSDGSVRLTMKQKVNNGSGYNEWETAVENFDTTVAIIDFLLPNPDLRIEFSHHREDWRLADVLININWFPKVAPLVEIEAPSEELLRQTAEKMGFNPDMLVDKGIVTLFMEQLGIQWGQKIKL